MEAAVTADSARQPQATTRASTRRITDLRARGEPFTWMLGGALALGIVMIIGFLALVLWNGFWTFVPKHDGRGDHDRRAPSSPANSSAPTASARRPRRSRR